MWNVLAHLSGPALTVAAIAVLGTSVRPVFRYPHMWRYLESRQKSDAWTSGAPIASAERGTVNGARTTPGCALSAATTAGVTEPDGRVACSGAIAAAKTPAPDAGGDPTSCRRHERKHA